MTDETSTAPQGAPETALIEKVKKLKGQKALIMLTKAESALMFSMAERTVELEAKALRLESVISRYDERFVKFEARLVEIINTPDDTKLAWVQKLAYDALGISGGSALATARNEALEEAERKCLELAHEEDECPDEFDDLIKRALIGVASSIRALKAEQGDG